jgi:hypothetical protein
VETDEPGRNTGKLGFLPGTLKFPYTCHVYPVRQTMQEQVIDYDCDAGKNTVKLHFVSPFAFGRFFLLTCRLCHALQRNGLLEIPVFGN